MFVWNVYKQLVDDFPNKARGCSHKKLEEQFRENWVMPIRDTILDKIQTNISREEKQNYNTRYE